MNNYTQKIRQPKWNGKIPSNNKLPNITQEEKESFNRPIINNQTSQYRKVQVLRYHKWIIANIQKLINTNSSQTPPKN